MNSSKNKNRYTTQVVCLHQKPDSVIKRKYIEAASYLLLAMLESSPPLYLGMSK